MKHLIGHTHNGISVYVDLIGSQAAKHIAQQPQLLALAREMLRESAVNDSEISIEYDMGRSIGYSFVVSTSEKDTVLYAQLVRDTTYTRFVKNGKPVATQYLTAKLRRDNDEGYELYDIWIGNHRPPRPGCEDETNESKSYWANHAFVLDGQPLQSQSITKTCPY